MGLRPSGKQRCRYRKGTIWVAQRDGWIGAALVTDGPAKGTETPPPSEAKELRGVRADGAHGVSQPAAGEGPALRLQAELPSVHMLGLRLRRQRVAAK